MERKVISMTGILKLINITKVFFLNLAAMAMYYLWIIK